MPFAAGVSTERDRAPVISVFVIYELADKCVCVSVAVCVIFSFCLPCIKGDTDKVFHGSGSRSENDDEGKEKKGGY